jgi:branched-chain amino acid transport system substrate-binding protein
MIVQRHSRALRAARLLVVALAALAGTAVLGGCQGGGRKVLRVGEFGSLTGGQANFGISTKEGIQMAIDDQNAAGGIGGVPLEITVYDDQSKPEEALTAVQKLVNADGVIAVLGEVASSNSLAGAPVCQRANVPMISPSSTNPKVTQVGDCIFRMCFIDPFQGKVMARYAWETLHLRRVAILKDLKSDYSMGLTQFFTESFTALGGTVVALQTYSKDDQDFRAQLTALKARNPDGVFVPGYYTEVGLIVRQAREQGITAPLFGGDGWESEQLTRIGGAAMEGCYFSTHQSMENPDPLVQNFVKGYQAKWKKMPDALAALGYDAARLLLASLQRLAAQDPQSFLALQGPADGSHRAARQAAQRKLRDVIAATRDFTGVTGKSRLDADRNAVKSAVVLKIKDGRFVYAGTVEP